ncbi:MAG: hypothetical protein IT204_11595 [Fimbriimonadaceae bacterium]|nr:hypothetical protein [Fimbriimonadaceae bacterium]
MKLRSIRVLKPELPTRTPTTPPRREPWTAHGPVACPLTRYPRYAAWRPSWLPRFGGYAVVVEAADGTTGFALGGGGTPAAAVIHEHLGPRLVDEPCLATERLYDLMLRLCMPFGAGGLASFATSAVDLALWDLKGKLLGRPVYELLGGPARDHLTCYATGNDTDWHLELGFGASKMACPYGPADGLDGLRRNEELVASRRELVGPGVELMLDCWMAFDEEYTVRLAETLRPYRLKWLEECLIPEDLDAHAAVRARLPWQTLATGEHWYTPYPFQHAVAHRLVDILQPDIAWCGGLTAVSRICALAEAAGTNVILHGGGNSPYGQHASLALPGLTWTEYFVGTPPGVPLQELGGWPGVPLPQDGVLRPSDAPGFGVELDPTGWAPYFG